MNKSTPVFNSELIDVVCPILFKNQCISKMDVLFLVLQLGLLDVDIRRFIDYRNFHLRRQESVVWLILHHLPVDELLSLKLNADFRRYIRNQKCNYLLHAEDEDDDRAEKPNSYVPRICSCN